MKDRFARVMIAVLLVIQAFQIAVNHTGISGRGKTLALLHKNTEAIHMNALIMKLMAGDLAELSARVTEVSAERDGVLEFDEPGGRQAARADLPDDGESVLFNGQVWKASDLRKLGFNETWIHVQRTGEFPDDLTAIAPPDNQSTPNDQDAVDAAISERLRVAAESAWDREVETIGGNDQQSDAE